MGHEYCSIEGEKGLKISVQQAKEGKENSHQASAELGALSLRELHLLTWLQKKTTRPDET